MTAHVTQWYCYNNIRAVLTLILVSTLGFADSEAFAIYATMIALGDINGMIGAYYGDKVVGHHFVWLFGVVTLMCSYFVGSIYFASLGHEGVYLLNMIACGIGISRCNGASLVYSAINREFPQNQRHSYNSLLYLMLITASFLAYSASGFINAKFGANGCFFTSFVLATFSVLLFTYTEFEEIKKYFSSHRIRSLFRNFFLMAGGLLGIVIFGLLSFKYYEIVSATLWLCFLSAIFYMIYLIKSKNSNYSHEEKQNIKMFIFYIFWFIIYFVFERQFGMIMPLILSRNFDNNFFGLNLPVTNVMSIFQICIIIFSIFLFKYKTHDKLSNKQCLFLGFSSCFLGYLILYIGSIFHINHNISFLAIFLSIILLAFSDLFILNRIFSICRVAPKKIHALTTAVMMVAAACSFHGAKLIANFVVIDKEKIADKAFTLMTYRHGFLINLSILFFVVLMLIIWHFISLRQNLINT
jgi:dipeptide/tripeptide permease